MTTFGVTTTPHPDLADRARTIDAACLMRLAAYRDENREDFPQLSKDAAALLDKKVVRFHETYYPDAENVVVSVDGVSVVNADGSREVVLGVEA